LQLETSAVSIVTVPVEQKMVTHERRDELAIFVKWFGCGRFRRGVAFVHVTYCTIQITCGSVQKICHSWLQYVM